MKNVERMVCARFWLGEGVRWLGGQRKERPTNHGCWRGRERFGD